MTNPTEWKIVPVEPDEAMGDAGDRARSAGHQIGKNTLLTYTAMLGSAPPSPFAMVAREDLLTFKYMVESIVKHGQYAPQSGLIFPDLHDRLTQALETPPQAEGE